jgi:hypothetical protein
MDVAGTPRAVSIDLRALARSSGIRAAGWVKRIGLAWTGCPAHPNDRRRSLPLARLAPLAMPPVPTWAKRLSSPCKGRYRCSGEAFAGIADLSNKLRDFGGTAATLMENLDVVITADTAMEQLAGGLGKPVWILIPKAADGRRMLDRGTSPW